VVCDTYLLILFKGFHQAFIALGGELIRHYNNSPALAAIIEYPELHWKPWKFTNTLKGWWRELGHLFEADDPIGNAVVDLVLEEVKEHSGLERLDDLADYIALRHMGSSIYRQFDYLGGVYNAVDTIKLRRAGYSTINDRLKSVKRDLIPQHFWKEKKNIRHFLDSLLVSTNPTDATYYKPLYTLTLRQLRSSGGL